MVTVQVTLPMLLIFMGSMVVMGAGLLFAVIIGAYAVFKTKHAGSGTSFFEPLNIRRKKANGKVGESYVSDVFKEEGQPLEERVFGAEMLGGAEMLETAADNVRESRSNKTHEENKKSVKGK